MVCLRLDELRHRLIPLYSYDPAEEEEWENEEAGNEDEELTVSKMNNPLMQHLNVNELIYWNYISLCFCARNLYTKRESCCSLLLMEPEQKQCSGVLSRWRCLTFYLSCWVINILFWEKQTAYSAFYIFGSYVLFGAQKNLCEAFSLLQEKLKSVHRCREELWKTHLQLQGNQRMASGGNNKLGDGITKEELVKKTNRGKNLGGKSLCKSLKMYLWFSPRLTFDPRWWLSFILWATAIQVLPALSQEGLACYFCPLHAKNIPCPNVTVYCKPHQRCLTSRGWYGSTHMLSGLGCVDVPLCGTNHTERYRGVNFSVSCDCCCSTNCNTEPRVTSRLKMILEKVQKILHGGAPLEVDSCANYTSTQTPATMTGNTSASKGA